MLPVTATILPPPDGAGRWLIAGAVVLAVLVVSSVRTAPVDRWLVITRFGHVVRVAESGLVLRLPLVDRSNALPRAPMHLPITVSARTCDGVLVHLLATAVVRIVDPAAAAVVADPGSSTALAVHDALARRIARAELADLLALRTELEPTLAENLGKVTAEWGVVVGEIVVDGIETELTAGLLGLAHRSRP